MDPYEQNFNAQAVLQQQNIDAEQSHRAGYMLEDRQAVQAALIEQINPNKIVEEIKLTLEGKIRDELGEIKQIGPPLMNDNGINKVIILVRSVVNLNTVMSAMEEKKINELMIELMDKIIDDLSLNWKEYKIKTKTDLDTIEGIIKFMAYPTLMRANLGGERRFLGRVTVENISTAPRMPEAKKEGFFSRFKL